MKRLLTPEEAAQMTATEFAHRLWDVIAGTDRDDIGTIEEWVSQRDQGLPTIRMTLDHAEIKRLAAPVAASISFQLVTTPGGGMQVDEGIIADTVASFAEQFAGRREAFLRLWQFVFAAAGQGLEIDGVSASQVCIAIAEAANHPHGCTVPMDEWNEQAAMLAKEGSNV